MAITLELRSYTRTPTDLSFPICYSPRQTVEVEDVISLEQIRNIEMAALGNFYIDHEGNAVYKSRFGRMG